MSVLNIYLLSIFLGSWQVQDQSLKNKVYDERIRTVQLYRDGWNLSYPVIKLNGNETLVLNFDLLGDRMETFFYTFVHCDKDWKKSDIFVNDYLEGFPENQIEDFKPSFNTTVKYFHYRLSFPNDKVKLTLSGNYILLVYTDNDPEKPAISQRFVISDDIAPVSISFHRPQMTSNDNAGQQVDFTVDIGRLRVTDPYRDIYCHIIQNGRWENARKNLKPDIYGTTEIKVSSLSDKNIFYGGNEFRFFDIRSIKYLSENVSRIDYMAPYYNVLLKPSENREFKPYFYSQDFNGKFYIATREGRDPDTDADYVNVFFTLPSKYLLSGGNMHVSGAFNNWTCDRNNLMNYNPQAGDYECTILLKQGWYNYEYVFLREGEKESIPSVFEASHYETENDYTVLVYYRNPRERFDRVIGTATANTLNRLVY